MPKKKPAPKRGESRVKSRETRGKNPERKKASSVSQPSTLNPQPSTLNSPIAAALLPLAEPIDSLRADPQNARSHDEPNIAAIRYSLEKYGQRKPIVCNQRSGQIEAGHGTLAAARQLGWTHVAVVWVDDDPHTAAGFALADNRTAELADWDDAKLADLLTQDETAPELDFFDQMGWTDFLEEQAGKLTTEALSEDPGPQLDRGEELQKKWKTAAGQLWLIEGQAGEHRISCGDCRQLLPTLAADSIAMIFTDPPYGHNNNNGDLIHRWEEALGKVASTPSAARPIANDGPEANELLRAILPEFRRVLEPGGCCCCCCCCGGGPDPQFARWSLWIDELIPFKMCVVWDKGGLGMGWHYRRCWECILVAEKPGAACKWYGGHDVPNIIRDIGKIIPTKDQHPTEKPIALPAWFISLHSADGETILDPFLGSGTTMVAAEQLGRLCYAMEIEPKYVAVALERLADLGLSPRLDSPQPEARRPKSRKK